MNNCKVIFIHGNGGGTGQDNWFPWCISELKRHGIRATAPDFPDPVLARAEYWLPFLNGDLGANDHTILVGHSSGALAAMRFAEKHEIQGSVLVGACYTDLGDESEKKSGYYDSPWNWSAIKTNQRWITQFASTDDPYIPIKEARHIRDQLQTDYHEFADRGHFGEDTGMTKFPELVDALLDKLESYEFQGVTR